MIYVHFGAGAGDLDARADYRCGFTEFIKKNYQAGDEIYLVEVNKNNIEKLNKCWENYQNSYIFNIGVVAKEYEEGVKKFFFSEDDSPHYQICSLNIDHVKKIYPAETIKEFLVKTISVNNFFKKYLSKKTIDYLSIDLEGIDFDIMKNINLKKYIINNISIEHLHMTKKQKKTLVNHLNFNGYSYCGFGYDVNEFDFLFRRKKIFFNKLISQILWILSSKHIKYLNNFISEKIN